MSIQAVVFDYGNVLSLPQEEGTIGLLATIAGIDEKLMEEIVWKKRSDYDRGTLSGIDYYTKLIQSAGGNADEASMAALVRADLESWANLDPKTVQLAEDTRNAGLKLGILSNMPHEFLALAKKRFPIFSQVDVGIYSCEVGQVKPEKGIYEALLKELGLPAEAVVFFDDMQVNVDAASALGFQSFLWKDAQEGRSILKGLGVSI